MQVCVFLPLFSLGIAATAMSCPNGRRRESCHSEMKTTDWVEWPMTTGRLKGDSDDETLLQLTTILYCQAGDVGDDVT